MVHVGILCEQRRDDLGAAVAAGGVQRRVAIVVGLVHVGVLCEQRRDDLDVAVVTGGVQRRDAIVGGLVHVGVLCEQRRDLLDVAFMAGNVQRRGAVIVLGLVHVDADRDHRPDVRRRDAQLLLLLFRLLLFCAFFKLKRRPTPCFLLP